LANIPRGRFDQPMIPRAGVGSQNQATVPGYVRVTSFESTAVRELRDAAARNQVVYLQLHGPRPGESRNLFMKSGYRAELLLSAAGYKQDHNGDWHKGSGDAGLEKWLLDYMTKHAGAYGSKSWGTIRLYQIFVEELDVPTKKQRKRDPLPRELAKRMEPWQPETIWRGATRKEA
jgi:hypothetical protein